jgi:MFS family permease
MLATLRANPPLRRLLGAWLQSCVGTGAAYVALLVLTLRHLHTAWAVSAVLLAEFVPWIALGSWFGALADRYPKRPLLIVASLVQAGAFAGLAVVRPTAVSIVGLALVAGIGGALQRPVLKSALPTIAGEATQLAAALVDTSRWLGITVGPLVTAGLLLVSGPALPLALNALSFAVAALVIATVPMNRTERADEEQDAGEPGRGVRAGLRVAFSKPAVAWLIACSAGQVIGGGLLNVCEPIYATRVLHGSGSAYAALVACYGLGQVVATVLVATRGQAPIRTLAGRYIAALALAGAGMAGSAVVGNVTLAAWTFAATGYGNGLLVVTETQIILMLVAGRVQGRLFGAKDTIEGIFFLTGLLGAGVLVAATGIRVTLGEAAGVCGVCAVAAMFGLGSLRRQAPTDLEVVGGSRLTGFVDTPIRDHRQM